MNTLNFYQYVKASYELWAATRKANRKHRADGKMYFVIPDENNKLTVINDFDFRQLKRNNRIDSAAKPADLKKECFYFTGNVWKKKSGVSSEEKTHKRLAWLHHYSKKRRGAI